MGTIAPMRHMVVFCAASQGKRHGLWIYGGSAERSYAMGRRNRVAAFWIRRRRRPISATKTIALTFGAIILLGACLLTLPAASRSGISCGFRPALFTATSATCVTGLVLYDTWSQWSGFGQVVIISLIKIGGLGFMSAATLFVFLLHK